MHQDRPLAGSAHASTNAHEAAVAPDAQPAATEEVFRLSRRSLLKAALVLPAAGILGCGKQGVTADHAVGLGERDAAVSPPFFNAHERAFVEAATARLIPDEEDGLGAKGAAVADFIDRQLAGPYGRAERWYMQGPWEKGIEQQGYQLKLSPAELYRSAIRDINAACRKKFSADFAALAGAVQDEVLHGLESGDLALDDVPPKTFFTMLWNNTVQGFLADPMYGGNRNFAGWKLIGFPGPRYNYVAEIEQYGKPYTLPTVGILGRQGHPMRRQS